jgi:hypothetical protein
VLQDADDDDFEIEAKFDSPVTQQIQIQGLLAQQDEDDFVRFEIQHDGSTATLFVGTLTSGTTGGNTAFLPLTVSGPIWLRMRRTGDTWTFSYSLNGVTFDSFTSFTHALTVTQVGLHVGNHGWPESSSPAFTALVDYFSVAGAPVPVNDGYSTDEDRTLVVPAATALPSNDVDRNPPDDSTALPSNDKPFDGLSDDVRVYDRGLSQQEIQNLMADTLVDRVMGDSQLLDSLIRTDQA